MKIIVARYAMFTTFENKGEKMALWFGFLLAQTFAPSAALLS